MTECNCPAEVKGRNWYLNEDEDKVCTICGGILTEGMLFFSSRGRTKKKTVSVSIDTQELIVAVNRTTHAVRAFVLFLFYQLLTMTITAFLYIGAEFVGNANPDCSEDLRQFGACNPNLFVTVLAAAVWVGGVIYSSQAGWQEIRKSEIRSVKKGVS